MKRELTCYKNSRTGLTVMGPVAVRTAREFSLASVGTGSFPAVIDRTMMLTGSTSEQLFFDTGLSANANECASTARRSFVSSNEIRGRTIYTTVAGPPATPRSRVRRPYHSRGSIGHTTVVGSSATPRSLVHRPHHGRASVASVATPGSYVFQPSTAATFSIGCGGFADSSSRSPI